MNELALMSLMALIGGGLLGYFMRKTIVENTGVPLDERGLEISKLAAMRTLELVLFVTVVLLLYFWTIERNEACANTVGLVFFTIFFGNLAFRAYYSRRM
ncbi:DUF2178 domain-containing protein [Thermococcus sp.]|uniref:DUF2178 domain-containing protein n=1 Tax=Thermococcus sp. TaxID=35749 RepID=UPI00263923C0|nr:DUF2178 domain-containing protein [Thermococcus sp.]